MMAMRFLTPVAAIALAISLAGCASTAMVQTANGPMPQYCLQNNTATGALIGGALGAALGGAFGGGRGAAIGGASGLLLGGATGSQLDGQCRQLALQRAMEMAEQQAAAERAAEQQAIAEGQRARYRRVAYQPVDYITPSNGRRHAIKPLNSYTDPVTKQTCNTYVEFSFAANGQSHNGGTHKACKGSDGTWHG